MTARLRLGLVPLLLTALTLGAAGPAAAQGRAPAAFHAASSEAETTLDRIVRLSEKDDNFLQFVLRTPYYKPKAGMDYAKYCSQRLLRDMAAMERRAVAANCRGTYRKGELCGADYNPLTCAQDMAEAPYRYRTESAAGDTVTIAYRWPGEKTTAARFVMVRDGGLWKIDAVACHPDTAGKP